MAQHPPHFSAAPSSVRPWRLVLAACAIVVGAWPVPAPTAVSHPQPAELLVGLRSGGVLRLRFADDVSLATVAEEYRQRLDVAYVEPNFRVQASAFPSDPDYAKQWYLAAIQARDAWSAELLEEEGQQVKTPVIAVVDTGVDTDQPELIGKLWTNSLERAGDHVDNDQNGYVDDWQGWDFIGNTPDPNPRFDGAFLPEAIHHGTIVAGVAAADSHNGVGIAGVSWKAKIMALRVLDAEGNGTVFDVLRAVEYAVAQRADIINLSFVGVDFSQALYDGLKAAADKNVVIVAAAGNTSDGTPGKDLELTPSYPICLDAGSKENFILGVVALNRQRQLSSFSNYGKGCVDLAAPGQEFYGLLVVDPTRLGYTQPYGGSWAGTSVAAPIISGAAAIVRSLRPELSAAAVRDILLASVDDITTANPRHVGRIGRGQINLSKAVTQTVAYRSSSATTPSQSSGLIVSALGFGSFPQLKMHTSAFKELKSFFAYAPSFNGSIAVAAGDVDGDGVDEIITGAGAGGGPHVRIFSREGQVRGQFFAFDRRTRHGVNVAVGNVDGKGSAEIIVAVAGNAAPQVAVFTAAGEKLASWYAYEPTFRGGVTVAAGDVDGDGVDEIITGAGAGGGPQVRIFSGSGNRRGQFFAYNALSRTGVTVAAGDVDGDGVDEVLASVARSGPPLVRVFRAPDYARVAEFYAYATSMQSGLTLAAGDVDDDGRDEIITGVGQGGGPHVRVLTMDGVLKGEYFAHAATFRGGVRVTFLANPGR
ncbi:MAG: S8 family serine peptidase [bacterium]|nr:S8 family serine peptidase [bacterium]